MTQAMYWRDSAIKQDAELRRDARMRIEREQDALHLCVLCGAQGTRESTAGIGWVCDSDHPEIAD